MGRGGGVSSCGPIRDNNPEFVWRNFKSTVEAVNSYCPFPGTSAVPLEPNCPVNCEALVKLI